MALCNAYRSFAVCLVIALLSESPVSAFTFGRARTTTLKPLDLTGEESALLEVKSELSKLNNERDNVKHGREKLTIRKSVNFLTPDKKLASSSRKSATTTSPLRNNDELVKPSDENTTRDPETTTGLEETKTTFTKKYRILNTTRKTKDGVESFVPDSTTDLNKGKFSNENIKKEFQSSQKGSFQNKSYADMKIEKPNEFPTTLDSIESTIVTDNIKTTDNELTTSEISIDTLSTTNINENETTKFVKESNTSENTQVGLTSTQVETSTTDTKTKGFTELENTDTVPTSYTESMIGQPSKSSTKNPSWKKYTVIERKRISTTEPEMLTTEELHNAESIASTTAIEKAISVPAADLFHELQDVKITTNKIDDSKSDLTTQESSKVLEPEIKGLASTQPNIKKDTTTIESVESKRAGYLDFSAKHTKVNEEKVTTETLYDMTAYNETELLGSIFEIDTQGDAKNATMAESQSQLADDAIKEELLKESVLNDHIENSKRLQDQQDLDKVKPLNSNEGTDDSLSVKPITHGKGGLYTVNSNYRKMKKIEVQPSKPFVRDPDDNSWRNESLTSLGIVFKAKNASKPFTQVLKNKTEAELNSLIQSERETNNEVPVLRERLEKIAEVRKSKKKKIDKFGEMIYSDYEEVSGETSSTPKTDTVSIPIMEVEGELFFVPSTTSSPVPQATQRTTTPQVYVHKEETVTTNKPKKPKFHEYYDTTDEYDADYLSLAKIDLKKFTTRLFANDEKTTTSTTTTTASPVLTPFTKQLVPLPDRKPTLQYFPPRDPPQKVNINDYDSDFRRKVNMFKQEKPPRISAPVTYGTPPPATVIKETPIQYSKQNVLPQFPPHKPANLDKNIYVTFLPHLAEQANRYPGSNDESFNRASYVIKHYKDLINEAVKDDYDKSVEFIPAFTESSLVGVTMTKEKDRLKHMDEDYDYDANFRKDLLNRFVDNFNQNSERFKVDFPILYNNTVVHMKAQENGKVVASSSAFMKRLYGDGPGLRAGLRPCDPHCEMKVELSPAYELHYYVPDQEEKEVAELKPATLPFSYRL